MFLAIKKKEVSIVLVSLFFFLVDVWVFLFLSRFGVYCDAHCVTELSWRRRLAAVTELTLRRYVLVNDWSVFQRQRQSRLIRKHENSVLQMRIIMAFSSCASTSL